MHSRLGQATQESSGQVSGPSQQLLVARSPTPVTGSQPTDHGVDPRVLLVGREPRRDEHDRAPALAIGADGPASLPAAPDLDLIGVHIQNLG